MTRTLRTALCGGATLLLVLAVAAPPALARDAWPPTSSDIRPDPAARIGKLPNGMTYVLLHNATPPHQVSIRLRIGAGSFNEADDQRGLAHFLEHMAFKGSAHVPEGEMVKLLQRHGLAFGPDTNAATGFDQTVYMLDLPQNDAESLDLGLMLMRETGSELNLDAKAMEPERGVVLSEERARDTPGYEASKKRMTFLMQGQLAPRRWPIGSVEVLHTAPASRLRDFYRANYRPEQAALVVVGDIEVNEVEAKIRARFADWHGAGPAGMEPDLGAPGKRGEQAMVIVQPSVTTQVSVSWAEPHDAGPDTRAKEGQQTIEALGLRIVNRRLARLTRSNNPPFLAAGVGRSDELNSIRTATLNVTPRGQDWEAALIAADAVRRQALAYGVEQSEIDQALTETRAQLKGAVEAAATRRTPALAQRIVSDISRGEVFTTPAENLSIFEEAVKGLSPGRVNTALRQAFVGNGPLLTLVAASPPAGGEAALLKAFGQAEAAEVKPRAADVAKAWPYASFGAPGHVVDRRDVKDLGVTYVHFANGIRLAFKQTDFRKDQVQVAIDLPGGLVALPKDRPSPVWAAGVLSQGGLHKIGIEDMQLALAGKLFAAGAGVGEQEYVLSGQTRRSDLDVELQVLTAYLTDPAWSPAAFERTRNLMKLTLDQLDATPAGALSRNAERLLHSGDPRWATPTSDQLAATTLSDVRGMWDGPMAKGPIDVVMVGDLTLDQAIDAVSKTLGALPTRSPRVAEPASARQVRFPAHTTDPVHLTHTGRADQAIAMAAWPSTDYFADVQGGRALGLAVQVLQDRLIQRVRIAEGATYSPSAASRPSLTFPGYGVVAASVETPPDRIPGFFAAVSDIARDLREMPVTTDELDRARKPRVEQVKRSQATNEFWLGQLTGSEDDPRRFEAVRTSLSGYAAVTAADIQAASRKYLRDDTAFRLTVTAAAKP